MKKVESIIRPDKLNELNSALSRFGIQGMTVTQVMGCGLQKGRHEVYRGTGYDINLLPKIKIEIVVPADSVSDLITLIKDTAYTGDIGDGKLYSPCRKCYSYTNGRRREKCYIKTCSVNEILLKYT